MQLINRESFLWSYLQPEIQNLINDGEILITAVETDGIANKVTDFSFLLFPFSKAYEGFLKKLFLDLGLIKYDDYYGDEIRIGRVLNPNYKHETQSLFAQMCTQLVDGQKISGQLWEAWKNARNLTFHYFPHNYKRLTFEEALALIKTVVEAMQVGLDGCGIRDKMKKSVKTLA